MSKKCTPVWREAHFEVKMLKTLGDRTTFGSCRCGAKHISKSKCTKHTRLRPLLEVEMSKKCTPLWREAHFDVKMYKTHHDRTTFGSCDVEKVHAVMARSTFWSQNVKNTRGSDHFWRFRCRFASHHYTTLHYITLHYLPQHYNYNYSTTQLHSTTPQLQLQLHNYTPLHSTTLHYTPLHYNYNYNCTTTLHYTKLDYTTLHYTTLHSITLHYITLHYLPLHFTTLHYTTLHYTTTTTTATTTQLHSTTLHYTKLHYTTLNYTTLNYTTLHYIAPHYIPLHYITLHYITLHYITLNDTARPTDR